MSTIHYSTDELANIASAICGVSATRRTDHVAHICESLFLVSMANTIAYNVRYGDTADPSNADEILAAMPVIADKGTTIANGNMLAYNCDDKLDTIPRLRAMVDIQGGVAQVAR